MNKKARRMTGLRRRESSSWTPFSKTWKTVSGFGNRGGRAEVRRYRRSRIGDTIQQLQTLKIKVNGGNGMIAEIDNEMASRAHPLMDSQRMLSDIIFWAIVKARTASRKLFPKKPTL